MKTPNKTPSLYLWSILLLLLLLSAFGATKIKYVYNIKDFHPTKDPAYQYFDSVQSLFQSGDNNLIIIGLEHTTSVLQPNYLTFLDSLEQQLTGLEGVSYASAMASLQFYVKTPLGTHKIPFFHLKDTTRFRSDTTLFLRYPDIHKKYLSNNKKATCIYVNLQQEANDAISQDILTLLDNNGMKNYYFHGATTTQKEFESTLKREMLVLTSIAFGLLCFFVLLFFRTWRYGVLLLLFIGMVNLLTLGVMALFKVGFNLLTVTVPSIVSVIAMSDIVHVILRVSEEDPQLNLKTKLKHTYQDLRLSLLLTSITTALGFIGIAITGVSPFISFGLITAAGIVIAYGLTLKVLPDLLYWMDHPTLYLSKHKVLSTSFFTFVSKHRKPILYCTIALVLSSGYLASKTRINARLYEDLASGDPLSQTLQFYETHFTGIRGLDLYLEVESPKGLWSVPVLKEIEKIEQYLYAHYGAKDVYSINTLIKRHHRTNHGGVPSGYQLPQTEPELKSTKEVLQRYAEKLFYHNVVAQEENMLKIAVKSQDFGSRVAQEKYAALEVFLKKNIDPSLLSVVPGGTDYYLDKSNTLITKKLFYSLFGAIIVIFILILVYYKSLSVAIIALVPNVLPLLLLLGILHLAGLDLNRTTAIVFTIAFGIAVDDTIHFLGRFKTELNKNQSPESAIKTTLISTGKAIFITSVLLTAGFSTLLFSSFQSTNLTGLLSSITLGIALFADVVLLPALLLWAYRNTKH